MIRRMAIDPSADDTIAIRTAVADDAATWTNWRAHTSVVVALTAVVPAVVAPRSADPYAYPKVLAFFVILTATACVHAWPSHTTATRAAATTMSCRDRSIDATMLAFVAVVGLSTAASTDPLRSLVGQRTEYQGFLAILAWVAVFALARASATFPGNVAAHAVGVVFGAALVSVYGLVQHYWSDPLLGLHGSGHLTSTIGQPNALGSYLVVALPMIVALVIKFDTSTIMRWSILPISIPILLTVVQTESRGASLALAASGCIVSAWTLRRSVRRRRSRESSHEPVVRGCSITLAAVFGCSIVAGVAGSVYGRLTTVSAWRSDESIENHLDVWRVAVSMTVDRPALGTGLETFPENFVMASRTVLSDERVAFFDQYRVESPHNFVLAISAGAGLFAAALLVTLAVLLTMRAIQHVRREPDDTAIVLALMASLGNYAITNFFMTTSIASNLVCAVSAGSLIGLTCRSAQSVTSNGPPRSARR